MEKEKIIANLPYRKPFLFVDELLSIDENGVVGIYTYAPESYFYSGHFKDFPVTPGVILIETMAQIGLVCLGLFLLKDTNSGFSVNMASANVDFLKPVFPEEKVTVVSEKVYFRFNKLNCNVSMRNEAGETVCKGNISGMLKEKKNE